MSGKGHAAWWDPLAGIGYFSFLSCRTSARRRRMPVRQPREDAVARAARHAVDRRHLERLDDRLLLDVGLDREALHRGLPFTDPCLIPDHSTRYPEYPS